MSQIHPPQSPGLDGVKAPGTPPAHTDAHSPNITRPAKPHVILDPLAYAAHLASERRKRVARFASRAVVTGAIVAAAIYLPGFERVMAFLGSFSAFLICIILPVSL